MNKYQEIKDVASHSIATTMREGEVKYPNDEWRVRRDSEDIHHAILHLLTYNLGDRCFDPTELRHALTRIALILRRKELR